MNKKKYTSYWFTRDYEVSTSNNKITITGFMYPIQEFESTPMRHVVLRLLSFLFGRMLIGYLKNRMIFSKTKKFIKFTRTLSKQTKGIRVLDTIELLHPKKQFTSKPKKASEFSSRHVASSESYTPVIPLQNSDLYFKISTNNVNRFYEITTEIEIGVDAS